MECAAASDNIRLNTVHPGVIDTPIWTKLAVSAGRNTPIDPHEVARTGVPLGRAGQAQDIANGVLFLASEASSYMTATELVIDGSMSAARRRDLAMAETVLISRTVTHAGRRNRSGDRSAYRSDR
jgi:NAD(P)-dependent dehydrogenase (short-subunit alcohol dehydrogenase family)